MQISLKILLLFFLVSIESVATAKTLGHIGSFFKQSERPSVIVDYVDSTTNRINIDDMYPNLIQLESNYFAFGFWTAEERSIYAWQDFREVLAQIQNDRPDISLYLYIGSPEYGNGGHFCWDESLTNNQCQQLSNYNDYIIWAEKTATISNEFSIVKGILIDDFVYSLSTHHTNSKLFTPRYLDEIRTTGKDINPNFRLETVWYFSHMSAYHAMQVSGHIDAVHGFYRHFDGDRIDPAPDRIVNELEMFSRAFSPNISPLVSVFREPDKPAIAGKKITVDGIVDISTLQQDLSIAYWDNLYSPTTSLHGWTQVEVFWGDQLLLEQDIMDGVSDNGLQVLQIPYSTIQSLQEAGINQAQLRIEISTLKSYSRWNYFVNLFVLSPENIPVIWSFDDEEGSYLVATSNDVSTSIDRYLGIYGGTHSSFDVSAEYTQRLMSHASHALNSNKVEGLVSWEIMMNPAESEVFSLYKNFYKGKLSPSILISPSQDIPIVPTTYSWNAATYSTWYLLWIKDYISGDVTTKWYSSEDANCLAGGVCSVTAPIPITSGNWWIRTWNNAGYGPWSEGSYFRVGGKPAKVNLISPQTNSGMQQTFIWERLDNASWYRLRIDDDTGNTIYQHWYHAVDASCILSSTNCQISIDTNIIGLLHWRVQAWNSAGIGDWSDKKSFVAQ